jgi:biopolymer transport protein ExbD
MQSGGGDDDGIVSGINVTPLVDITLVLLIIFMVTANFVSEQGLKVQLPKISTQEAAPTPALTVAMDKLGDLVLMKKKVTLDELRNELARETRLDPNVKVLLKAQKDLTYEQVAQVLDVMKLAGVAKVALAMERK